MKKVRVFICVVFVAVLISLLSGCVAKVPMPKIKDGRFNFSVTYEVDGQETTYSGVYVCEIDGVYISLVGRGVEWNGYIEGQEEVDLIIQSNEDGVIYLNFGFIPEYFMDDPDAVCYDVPSPSLYMIYHNEETNDISIAGEEEIAVNYGVRLISYEYAKPIENTFEEKLSFARFELSIN